MEGWRRLEIGSGCGHELERKTYDSLFEGVSALVWFHVLDMAEQIYHG